MAFTLQVDSRGARRSSTSAPLSTKATLIVFAALFGAFCIYDASMGDGHVLSTLAQAQRWVQGILEGLRPRI